jgi:hypothetical protein
MYCNYAHPALVADRLYVTQKRYMYKNEMRKQAVMVALLIFLVCIGFVNPIYLAIDVVGAVVGLIR